MVMVVLTNGQNQECINILAPYTGQNSPYVGIQMTMVDQSGMVVYARGSSLSCCGQYPDSLYGTMNYPAVFSNATNCDGSNPTALVQPFDVSKSRSLFYDRGSFLFTNKGVAKVYLVEGQGSYQFNLSYCHGNILTGHTDTRSFIFHLSNTNWGSIGTQKCGDPEKTPFPLPQPPSPKIMFQSTKQGQWTEGGSTYYSQWTTLIVNTGTIPVSNLILTPNFSLRDETSIWRLTVVSANKYTPSYATSIPAGGTYEFSFIKVGIDSPSFTIV